MTLSVTYGLLLLLFYISLLPADIPILLPALIVIVFLLDNLLLARIVSRIADSEKDDKYSQPVIKAVLKKTLGRPIVYLFGDLLVTFIYASLPQKHDKLGSHPSGCFSYSHCSNAKDIFWVVAMAQIPTLPLIHLLVE